MTGREKMAVLLRRIEAFSAPIGPARAKAEQIISRIVVDVAELEAHTADFWKGYSGATQNILFDSYLKKLREAVRDDWRTECFDAASLWEALWATSNSFKSPIWSPWEDWDVEFDNSGLVVAVPEPGDHKIVAARPAQELVADTDTVGLQEWLVHEGAWRAVPECCARWAAGLRWNKHLSPPHPPARAFAERGDPWDEDDETLDEKATDELSLARDELERYYLELDTKDWVRADEWLAQLEVGV